MIVFSHGNGFPGGTYRSLLQYLESMGWVTVALDRFGHEPSYPVRNNWPTFITQLADFTAKQITLYPKHQVYLVGHSLGGIVSLMTAAAHPCIQQANLKGVVLLDSPVLAGWKAGVVGVAKKIRLIERISPGKVSQSRRTTWMNSNEAYEHFAKKSVFARWHPDALKDYIDSGTEQLSPTECRLRFDRHIETKIYNTIPHHLQKWLHQHPLQMPIGFIGGTKSNELRQVGLTYIQRLTYVHRYPWRLQMLEGTHLFPMENPHTTALTLAHMLGQMQ